MEGSKRKYVWLGLGALFYVLSFVFSHYFFQFIFLGSLGVIGFFVYDALDLIYSLNARHLDDMRANMEIIMAEREIDQDTLVRRKIQNTK